MKIEELDPNFKIPDAAAREDTVFYDVKRAPFRLYGLSDPTGADAYHRMPPEIAKTVSPGVAALNYNTAGGRVRFRTDSPYITVAAEYPDGVHIMPHMPLSGSAGFDLYREGEDGWKFVNAFFPDPEPGKARFAVCRAFGEGKMRNYTLNFPLYNGVKNVYVGISRDAVLEEGAPYRNEKPVVFYGSSITQGACASRPGNCYEAILSHRHNFDYINLGFSGSAKGEKNVVDYMKSLEMSIFVCDYDHNAPDFDHLKRTLPPLYRAIREAHPDVPFIFASAPVYGIPDTEGIYRTPIGEFPEPDEIAAESGWACRRRFIYALYAKAVREGDKNVRFVDGGRAFDGETADSCTIETCHPNDIGFLRMADAFDKALSEFL